MEERILISAAKLFFSCGIKSVTMDDISRSMGISKKTIYQFYGHKKEIVEKVILNLISGHRLKMKLLREQAGKALQEVALQTEAMTEIVQSHKPGLLYEVQKYFPASWLLVDSHRNDAIYQGIILNLERGIMEGLYRPEIDVGSIAQIRLVQHKSLIGMQEFPPGRFEYRKIVKQLTELYLYGIASPQGQLKISKYINLNN